jgi:deoxyhypusine monooxygenase
LENGEENPMVRHEAAEALGAIGSKEILPLLAKHSNSDERVVKESCLIALDIHDYYNSEQFQYADGLSGSNVNT